MKGFVGRFLIISAGGAAVLAGYVLATKGPVAADVAIKAAWRDWGPPAAAGTVGAAALLAWMLG